MAWVVVILPLLAGLVSAAQQSPMPPPQSAEFFETRVRPVLASNCYDCHTDQHNGGLRVDSRDALLKGGRRGPAIVPGDPDKSLLIQAVRLTDEKLKMPKGGRLSPGEIDALLGIDHTKLTYRYSGRDFRLTDVSGSVIHEIVA